jgi:hypothetical protein
MDAFVLSTLLFNTIGIAVIMVALALAYCWPQRRSSTRR